ncbi:hypothetical protein KCU98_g8399, partial [Aureobasidium melanogenum]
NHCECDKTPQDGLICRSTAYVWQSVRDAQFSADYGLGAFWAQKNDLGSDWDSSMIFSYVHGDLIIAICKVFNRPHGSLDDRL